MKPLSAGLVVFVAALCLAGVVPSLAQSGGEKPAPPTQDKAAPADPVTGDWDGVVDMQEGPLSFSMKLKLEKDKVTGEVASPQGTTPITEGSWVDGKLTIAFTYVDGAAIVLTGALTDGNLAGSLSYGGGQMVMNWAAKRQAAK